MVLYLYDVCNKNMRIYIYKQIRFSVIVSVEYKSTNTNVQGKNVMFVLFGSRSSLDHGQSVIHTHFSKIFFSETAWPIKVKLYVERPWVGQTKV